MPFAALRQRHFKRLLDRGRDGFRIVWIDEQRSFALVGCPGEARENENSRIFGVLGRDIFFGHEVHAVAQGRDESRVGRTIKTRQRRPTVCSISHNEWASMMLRHTHR